MRIRLTVVLFLLAMPALAYSQVAGSMLNFPRAFTPSDLALTGFAIVNPTGTDASITFTLYSTSGSVLGTSTQTVTARGQFSRLGTGAGQLFPNVSQAGWVQATSSTVGLQGFWLGGDFETFTDGAEAATEAQTIVFPLVAPNTEINVANIGPATNNITIRIYGTAGTELATAVTRSIAVGGVFKDTASVLFPTVNLANATHIKVEGSANVSGVAVMTGYLVSPSWAVVNGVNASSTVTEANFPHVVSGSGFGGNYTTVVGATNLASASQTVSVTFTPSSGSPVTVQRTIPVNGSFRETAASMFSLSAYTDGWVKIAGTAALTGFVAYSDSVKGGVAVVPVQATPRTQLLFAHVADGPPQWLTGIALLNASSTAANFEIFVMTPDGSLVGSATTGLTINPGSKYVNLLRSVVPQAQGRNSGFIYIRTTNNVALYGTELFFREDLAILANVTAGALATGITFTPPTPPLPLTLTSASATTVARGATVTLTGTGFSTTASSNTVAFSGSSGTVNGTVTAATATSLTVTVPQTAISGPVTVTVGAQTSSALIITVTASATALAQNPVTVTAGATSNNVDIYVATSTSGLNATALALLDAGFTGSFSVGGSSVEILRGQTKDLVISGTALSAANGTTVAITGLGITVSNMRFQNGLAIVQIAVSATAELGLRNIVVTNSNLDTTVMTGGLFVR
ncbi:MAG: hypothetical protein HY646_20725 [Acidobacteria bacterium]|nr:hypothetical protein [Acidobacteriota bacterium]